jgi:ADP-ribosylglycohydrolase
MASLVRARQSLIGLSVGDAFGETMFGEPGEVAKRAAKRLISMRRPWRWTDDTARRRALLAPKTQSRRSAPTSRARGAAPPPRRAPTP